MKHHAFCPILHNHNPDDKFSLVPRALTFVHFSIKIQSIQNIRESEILFRMFTRKFFKEVCLMSTYYFLPTRNVFGEGAVNEVGDL